MLCLKRLHSCSTLPAPLLMAPYVDVQVEEVDADYDPDFLRHIYPRLEWPALREAAQVMGEHAALQAEVMDPERA